MNEVPLSSWKIEIPRLDVNATDPMTSFFISIPTQCDPLTNLQYNIISDLYLNSLICGPIDKCDSNTNLCSGHNQSLSCLEGFNLGNNHNNYISTYYYNNNAFNFYIYSLLFRC